MNAMLPKDKQLSRRSFLDWLFRGSLAGASLLGLGAIFRYISFPSESSSPNQVDLGPVEEFPVGTRKVVASGQAFIMRDSGGLRALSLVCPHLGCIVSASQDEFSCPCHGSRFTSDGSLRNGPASGPLIALRVEKNDDGHLILYFD